jgi:SAM-dependent methyltransferase
MTQDPIARFSSRVENYAKYRPGYPEEVLEVLARHCGLTAQSIIADIGSGTGILSALFLRNGNRVFGVEPNASMRQVAEQFLKSYEKFISVDGTAEATTLEPASMDMLTAGQAFHWFDRVQAKTEFARILKPSGYVVLIWNERRLDSTPFLRALENLLLRFGTDYEKVRHENVDHELAGFFAPQPFELKKLENSQKLDFDGLKGRVCSASYTPEASSPEFQPMLDVLRRIFDEYQTGGSVVIEYDTNIFYGRVNNV